MDKAAAETPTPSPQEATHGTLSATASLSSGSVNLGRFDSQNKESVVTTPPSVSNCRAVAYLIVGPRSKL